MEQYIIKYITNDSKTNLRSLNLTNDFAVPQMLLNMYDTYNKIFNETKSVIVFTESNNKTEHINNFIKWHDSIFDVNDHFVEELKLNKHVFDAYLTDKQQYSFHCYDNNFNLCKKIIHLSNIFFNYVNIIKNNNTKCVFHIFPNTIQRKLISDTFDPLHVSIYEKTNTAFTTSGETRHDNTIFLTKRDEISKLMIHELLHFFDMDGKNDFNLSNHLIDARKKMPFKDNNIEHEIMAELFCNIYNSFNLTCIISKENNFTTEQQHKLLKTILSIERDYSVYVVAKILKYFDVDPKNLFNSPKKIKINSPINLYYILKSIAYFNLDIVFSPKNGNLTKNIFEPNEQIFLNLHNILEQNALNETSQFMKKLNMYFEQKDILNNLMVSYICLDIDLDMINFDDINLVQKGGGEYLYYKYQKYKYKYTKLKLK